MEYESLYIKRTFVISINFKKGEIYFKNISFVAVYIKITFFLYALYFMKKHDKYFSPFRVTIVKQIIANSEYLPLTNYYHLFAEIRTVGS